MRRRRACSAKRERKRCTTKRSSSISGLVEPSLAGPKRPQDRVSLTKAKTGFQTLLPSMMSEKKAKPARRRSASAVAVLERPAVRLKADTTSDDDAIAAGLDHGAVVVAAITSCTNTSNPSVMIGAGLLAKKGRRARAHAPAVGEDEPRAGIEGRDRLPRQGRADAVSRHARLQPGRLRLHDLHRQQRPAARRGLGDRCGKKSGRLLGIERQPQFRGTYPVAGARELSRVAAAGRRVCARRTHDASI